MSGHSHWATTHRHKALTDAKKAAVFTKAGKIVTIAARKGADPAMNFSLRMAIDQARAVNMPKDNIERAIAKASGASAGDMTEVLYEGYTPQNVPIIIKAVTDNGNRTLTEVRTIFTKSSGRFGNPGSVGYLFNYRAVLTLPNTPTLSDDQQLAFIDVGANDFTFPEGESAETLVLLPPDRLAAGREAAIALGFAEVQASFSYLPITPVELSDADRTALGEFMDKIEDNMDVSEVWVAA